MKTVVGAFLVATAFAVAGPLSTQPAQARPALTHVSDVQASDNARVSRAVTDISAQRYHRRYGYRGGYYRPRYYRPYGYGYRPYYRPYGYYGYGYRRPGIYLGF